MSMALKLAFFVVGPRKLILGRRRMLGIQISISRSFIVAYPWRLQWVSDSGFDFLGSTLLYR
jgi:hypothetical protein